MAERPDSPFRRDRRHGRVTATRHDDGAVRRPRRASTGSATGAIGRPVPPPPARPTARRAPGGRVGSLLAGPSRSRYGDDGVASIGEARAHRRLRESERGDRGPRQGVRGSRPDPRQRARRTIKTTKPLLATRFGAGRPRFRLIATLASLLVVFAVVLGKVGLMQGGGQAAALRSEGAEQWTRTRTLPAQRGAIFDRNGDELALSVPAATVAVNPMQVQDAAGTAHILAEILGEDDEWEAELRAEIEQGHEDVGFVYVARQIDPALARQISSLEMLGVSTYPEDRRIMPGGETGRAVIGRTDIDGNGISGLELQFGCSDPADCTEFSDVIAGRPGTMSLEVAPGGRSIAGSEEVVQAPVPGLDLVTSLDRSVQHAVEQALVNRVNVTEAQGGHVIVMLTNGDIIAMASVERNDDGIAVVSSGNWAAVGSYEPGSVGKVITVAGALEDGVVTPDTGFYVPWQYDCTIDANTGILSDAHFHEPESLTTSRILAESSNVGTILVSRELGYEREYHYLTAFGLGEATALGFPGESPGILEFWEEWEGTERCTIPYGQGLAATPVQLVTAVNVIANDGVYAAPRIVTATVGANGEVSPADPTPTHYVLSPEVAAEMQLMMRDVVCDGTAAAAQVNGLSVAGKTGTAYKAQPDGTYFNAEGKHNYYSSFVGFFPAEDPAVTILVSIDDPTTGFNSGAQSAAPLFQELVPTIRHELGVVPPPGSTDCQGN